MPRALLAIGILILSTFLPVGLEAQVETNPANGHHYFVTDSHVSVADARLFASFVGGYIAAINDAGEQAWIVETLEIDCFSTVIGLTDEVTEGVFLWESGEPFDYENWAPGEPLDPSGLQDWTRLWTDGLWINSYSGGRTLIETPADLVPSITGLSCQPLADAILLTWTNGAVYDSIELYRNGALVETLAGTTESHLDDDLSGSDGSYWIRGLSGGLSTAPRQCFERLLVEEVVFYVEEEAALPSTDVDVSVSVDHPSPWALAGWSYGVCSDADEVEVLEISLGADADAWAFWSPAIYPDGWTIGVVTDFAMQVLEPGLGHEIEVATYHIHTAPDTVVELEFCKTLGCPPVDVCFVVAASCLGPVTVDGFIAVSDEAFIRGDGDGDAVLGLADVLFLVLYLFQSGPAPPCLEGGDIDDSGVIGLEDVVYLAFYLFVSGPPPAPPFPLCGLDPDAGSGLGCEVPLPCP